MGGDVWRFLGPASKPVGLAKLATIVEFDESKKKNRFETSDEVSFSAILSRALKWDMQSVVRSDDSGQRRDVWILVSLYDYCVACVEN